MRDLESSHLIDILCHSDALLCSSASPVSRKKSRHNPAHDDRVGIRRLPGRLIVPREESSMGAAHLKSGRRQYHISSRFGPCVHRRPPLGPHLFVLIVELLTEAFCLP